MMDYKFLILWNCSPHILYCSTDPINSHGQCLKSKIHLPLSLKDNLRLRYETSSTWLMPEFIHYRDNEYFIYIKN